MGSAWGCAGPLAEFLVRDQALRQVANVHAVSPGGIAQERERLIIRGTATTGHEDAGREVDHCCLLPRRCPRHGAPGSVRG